MNHQPRSFASFLVSRVIAKTPTQLCAILLPMIFGGCSDSSTFKGLTSSVLSSTGLVSASQAEALVGAGQGLAKAATKFTSEEEYYLGRGVSAMILSKYTVLHNPALTQYVNRVGQSVVAFSDRPETFNGYHFIVLDSLEINAFAAPSGFVFITKGFIDVLPDEDALAGVLAHEVGHISAEDGLKTISRANLTEAFAILGKEAVDETVASKAGIAGTAALKLTEAFAGSVDDIFKTLVTNGYSRSQEYSADRSAAQTLKRAGYNPQALLTLMETLEKAKVGGGIFVTHPAPSDRMANLSKEVETPITITEGQKIREKRFAKAINGIKSRSNST